MTVSAGAVAKIALVNQGVVIIPAQLQRVGRREYRPLVTVAFVTRRRARVAPLEVGTVAVHLGAIIGRKAEGLAVTHIGDLYLPRDRLHRVQGGADVPGDFLVGEIAIRQNARKGKTDEDMGSFFHWFRSWIHPEDFPPPACQRAYHFIRVLSRSLSHAPAYPGTAREVTPPRGLRCHGIFTMA